ncbi:DUF6193 family natural product biosynthesis protein [Streptomyces sp. NPDC048428]|uniref:DUF6193 family natural product biosynthesis protein n=1 Tax=Streptomyces sp. NPDC048428 TaxID=3154503 RepID=UPI00341737CD
MLRAAHAEPGLRGLFPLTSHGSLLFSRCTGFPFSRSVSAIYPLGDRRYAVHRSGEPLIPDAICQVARAMGGVTS